MEPVWISRHVALVLHNMQLKAFGGSDGVRDITLLESALAKAQNLLAYGDPPPDIFDLAAAYAYGIARNHPFVDGNKRTALVVSETFLARNGHEPTMTEEENYLTFYALAAGEITEKELAAWFRSHSLPLED